MKQIVSSLVVSCGSGVEGEHIVLELDDILNEDKTSFQPGDTIYLRCQYSDDVVLESIKVTNGSVKDNSTVTREEVDTQLWIETTDDNELSYIPSSSLGEIWYGNTGDCLKKEGVKQTTITSVVSPALVRIDYSSVFYSYKVLTPDIDLSLYEDETYPITVVANFESS